MKTGIAILFSLLICTFILEAQNPRAILDKANTTYNESGVIVASFTIDTEDVKAKTTYSQDGKAYLKGDKFKIDVVDGTTWFDGATQWVYVKGSEEVNVSKPTGEELAAVSPAVLLNIYKSGFKLNYKGEKKIKGKSVYSVELVPEDKKSEYKKMEVNIDKATNLFSSIHMYGKNGMNNHLTVKTIQSKVNESDNIFTFNKKDYPKIDIIDLR